MNKKVIVVIVVYNGAKWIKKCLESLEQSEYNNEVIIIDNCSTDDSLQIISLFPKIVLIKNNENLGFGKANNLGIQKALGCGADYVFLLNQDTWVFPKTISNLVVAAQTSDEFGIISPIHYSGNENILDASFKIYWDRKVKSISSQIDEVHFVNAAAWLLPKKVLEKVGFFETMFAHYGEDRNYSDRIIYHKYKTVIVKNAMICHDRIISRNFSKDVIQSKFSIQRAVLNINNNLVVGYFKALKAVFGLPKYFSKFYSFYKVFQLFWQLLICFISLKLHLISILKARKSYR